MINFMRLNPVSESILRVLLKHGRATPENLSFALDCDKAKLGKNLVFLMEESYVINTKSDHEGKVYADDEYRITVKGENYLSSVKFYTVRDWRQFVINVITGTTALTALIKAFWNEISAVILL